MLGILISSKNKLIAAIVLALALGVGLYVAWIPTAGATTYTFNVHGYAWSDTIGWISLNCAEPTGSSSCTSYGVNVNSTSGDFDGYAWSDNVGWINFGSNSCGTQPKLDLSTGNISGWAMAVAGGSPGAGGWDGCIHMNDSSHTPAWYRVSYDSAGTTSLPGHPLSGYAWGDINLGAIDFGYASIDLAATPAASLTFSASPTSISSGGSSTLTWVTLNVGSCSASGAWSGKTFSASEVADGTHTYVVSPTATSTYTITCLDTTGSAFTGNTQSVTVTVAAAPSISCSIIPASTVVRSTALPKTFKIGALWTGSTFYSTALSAATAAGSSLSASFSGSPVTSATVPATLSVGGTSSSKETITISGTPSSSSGVSSCTTASVYVVQPGTCGDICADPSSIGTSSCTYTAPRHPNCTNGKRPPWEEI